MKTARISERHGNMQALDAVLDDIKSQKCEKIFCLGDLAMAGPEPENTVKNIIELSKNENFILIQGNTDEMIVNCNEKMLIETKNVFPIMGNALENDVISLSDSSKIFLRNLPKTLNLSVENVDVLLVHGSPRKNNE